jgi:hypothetical protein
VATPGAEIFKPNPVLVVALWAVDRADDGSRITPVAEVGFGGGEVVLGVLGVVALAPREVLACPRLLGLCEAGFEPHQVVAPAKI